MLGPIVCVPPPFGRLIVLLVDDGEAGLRARDNNSGIVDMSDKVTSYNFSTIIINYWRPVQRKSERTT